LTEAGLEERPEDAAEEYRETVSREFVDAVRVALAEGDVATTQELVEPLHYSDAADLIENLDFEERQRLLEMAGEVIDSAFLTELGETLREEVFETLGTDRFANAVADLDADDAVDVIEGLDEADQRDVLDAIPVEDRVLVEQGLGFPEDSAGRMMQREVVAIPTYWTVGETIDYMRETEDLPDDFYDIFVVDPTHRPIGTLPLNKIMRTKRPVIVHEIMQTEHLRPIQADMDQEEVAYLFRHLDLVSAPVVDDAGRLIGVITIDDIVDVIDEEAEEDILSLAGVTQIDVYQAVLETTRSRFSWLLVNLFTAILASLVIGLFAGTIDQLVALAVLMPIVASMGGNAGTQTLTVAVRALAMRELTSMNQFRFMLKELLVGFINGVLFAILMGVVAWLWFASPLLGVVIAIAMVVNLIVAGLAGTGTPIVLQKLGIDPAIASSVFVTTVTDVVGFFAFLGLAALILL